MKKTVISLAATAALSGALCAENIVLEPLSVTSTPLDDSELDAAGAVEVYTGEAIEKAHVQSLYEFINTQTSLFAMPSFGNPMAQKLDLHGYGIENGYQNIVITVDGRRLNNVDMVPQLLSAIAPSDIERLEIIKGGGIVLGGDGANAGVVNIVTKSGDGGEVGVYGGVYDTYDGNFRIGHTDEYFRVTAAGEAYRTGGTRHIDAQQNRDTQKQANGGIDLAITPTAALELRLGLRSARNDVNYGGPMTQDEYEADPSQPGSGYGFGPAPSHQRFDSDVLSAGVSYDVDAHWSLNADAFSERKKSDYVTYGNVFYYDYRSVKADAEYVRDGFRLIFGADLFDGMRKSDGNAYAAANETTKRNTAGYALAQYRTGAHTFKAGYRYEQVDYVYRDGDTSLDDNDGLNGVEAGYNYRIDPAHSVFVNYAHAYQAPDIDRFFTPDYATTPPTVRFNGFIKPMESDSFGAGYTAVTPTNKLKIAVYYTLLRNEIYYYSDPGFIASGNTNLDRSHKYGLDLFDTWQLSEAAAFSVNYNYVRAIIDEEMQNGEDFSGNTLPGVSAHTLKAGLNFTPAKGMNVILSHTYRSEAYAMNDLGNDFAQRQQPYNSTDFSVAYSHADYELFAKISNLFNTPNALWVQDDAIYPVNFTTTANAGVRMKF